MWRAESFFGFQCPQADWEEFFGCNLKTKDEWEAKAGPRFTFGGLADFIAERVEVVPLEPASVLGKACDAAGAFRAIETVARQLRPGIRAFGPSTPIRRVFIAGRLTTFWNRLRWMTEEALPPLRTTMVTKLRWACCAVGAFMSIVISIFAIVTTIHAEWLGALRGLGAALCAALCTVVIYQLLARADNRLPPGLRTFKDLATAIAKSPAFGRTA